ncbi:hypothetical protein DRQ36_03945 [bacterium]|nr:MAG: hypothetical protein DRQ36_03945 [bacterium]
MDILNLFYYLRFSFVPSQKNSIFVEIMIEYKYTVIKYLSGITKRESTRSWSFFCFYCLSNLCFRVVYLILVATTRFTQ